MSQSSAWVILTRRYGEDVRQPSEDDLTQAVNELFNENYKAMTETDYAEHPNAWVRYGFDEGPMFVIEANRDKTVTLLKYADQDDVEAIAKYTVRDKSGENILSLWKLLAKGEIEEIRMALSCLWLVTPSRSRAGSMC